MNNDDNSKPEDKPDQKPDSGWQAPPENDNATEARPEAAAEDGQPDEPQKPDLETENAELKDKLLRVMAEMENLRRRTEREKHDATKYAISKFAQDMLGIGDNLARALSTVNREEEATTQALKSLIDGMELTEREMHNVLARHGIEKLDPKGEKFDPNFHQAMFEVENADVPRGMVVEVIQTGYRIGERVLRPAMVGVSKGGPKAVAPQDAEAGNGDAAGAAPEPAAADAKPARGPADNQAKTAKKVDKGA
jgi:molecular chaperone GrpE